MRPVNFLSFHMLRLLFILPFLLATWQDSSWRLDKDKNDIRIYTRKLENYDVRQFRAEATTPAPLSRIDSLLRNISNYPNWMPDISSARLVQQENPDTYIYYMTIETPALVSERDLVTKMQFSYPDDSTLRIDYLHMPEAYPEQENFVRMAYFKGFWEFRRTGSETIIRNEFLSDPSGSLPTWVINSFLASNPYNTVLSLKEQIE